MTLKKIAPYLLTSLMVIGFWKLETWTDNYAHNPTGKELLMLDIALTSIFYYKVIFWLVISNLTVFLIQRLKFKDYRSSLTTAIVLLAFYLLAGRWTDKKCAFHYYSVFINQSTMEKLLSNPLIRGGYHVGPILTENISNKNMKYRRYAIGGLERIKYSPAASTLTKILLDKSEPDVFRADAFQALNTFDTDETRQIVSNFRNKAKDSLDKKVLELANYWSKHP